MPLHTSLITAGAGSTIPITGGAAESGDISTVVEAFGPVTIGGVFGNAANNASGFLIPIAIVAAVVLGVILFKR